MPLLIEARQERTITLIRLEGSLAGIREISELETVLSRELRDEHFRLVLEVRDVTEIDEAGVQLLQSTQAKAQASEGDLKLACARYALLAQLAFHEARRFFPFYVDTRSAVAGFFEGQDVGPDGVRHFDILEFVKEQEKENEEQESRGSLPDPVSG